MNFDFHRNHFLLYNIAFWGFIFLSLIVAIVPAFQAARTPPTPGLQPLTPEEARGRELYVAEGCSYCHTQQVRPLLHDRVYGRPSAPGDFAYATPQLLGTQRTGPDLANIGNRQPDETWHLLHLYNPRIVVRDSVMPGFTWYFEVQERQEPGDIVVPVQPPHVAPGKVVVATRDAMALVAYLQSLKQPKLDLKMLGMQEAAPAAAGGGAASGDTAALGTQVFGANCARCHQPEGTGIPGVAPPLRGNAVVTAADAGEHIRTVLFGQGGKTIDGRQFPGRMPAFHDLLSDAEIAAVISHERRSWGNNAPTTTAEAVSKERQK
jgi:cytochrome c oxidase cbb3-type subunit 2